MNKLFLTVLNMSLTGAFVIAAICLARLPLKKAPKIISYCLWAVAGFRLVFPYSIESMFSLIPFKAQPIPPDIAMQPIPRIDSGIPFVNNAVSSILPAATPAESVNPLQIWTTFGAYIWLIGVIVMFIYGVVSFFILKWKMRNAAHNEANIYEAENIQSPFVLGILTPGIYLPVGLSEQEKSYIILHEQTHIRRHDHIVKFAAYFILCLHWFNPLAWVAFLLMGVDMEMSCDERVLKELGGETKKAYSLLLLSLATERRMIGGSPLAFGEGGIKERIKNVLDFRKPSRIVMITSVVLVAALSIGFAVNRVTIPMPTNNVYEELLAMRIPYVGDNSAVGEIIYHLPGIDSGHTQRFFSIGDDYGTGHAPHTLTVYYEPNDTDTNEIRNITVTPKNAALLFALIDNLEEVNYAFRPTPGNGELDKAAYSSRVTYSKDDVTGYLETIGLAWEDFQNDWNGSVEKMFAPLPVSEFEPRKWLDYYLGGPMSWTSTYDLMLDEFPGVMFSCTSEKVTAANDNGIKDLLLGMPVWNVYLADLNGDGLPEFCATVSVGSGIVDDHIIVCDYANDKLYELSDRMYFDYFLSLENGRLVVKQTRYPTPQSAVTATGELVIVDGELIAVGIDRTRPDSSDNGNNR